MKQFVRVLCDVHCQWESFPPVYRAYVNDQLFAERTFVWTDSYLEELFQIEAEPGQYHIRYELVPPHLARLTVDNFRVEHGPGVVHNNQLNIAYAPA
jgi:hypothetical protein